MEVKLNRSAFRKLQTFEFPVRPAFFISGEVHFFHPKVKMWIDVHAIYLLSYCIE